MISQLEANYAYQQQVEMIPLLVEKGYRPKGECLSQSPYHPI